MDHQSLVASLPADQRRHFTQTSDAAGLKHLALHIGAITVVGMLIAAGVPGWWALLPVQGILLVFLFTLEHETVHLTPFRSRWLNLGAGWLAAIILALPWNWFRYFHFGHHRHTQDPARDPELAAPKPETIWQFIWHVSGLPVWWSHLTTLARNAAGANRDGFVPERGRDKVIWEARAMLAGYAALATASWLAGSMLLFWTWLLPVLLGQPFLRIYLLAEHGRCPLVANMLENSRTTFTNRIVRFVAWNMPYHAEHHAYPAVPFHKLPEFHQITRDHLRVTQHGYANFAADYASSLGRTPVSSNRP
jgi:fatty acid desaturase